jgi:RHS repeat-associated protein
MTPTTGSPTTYTYDPRGNRTTNKIGTAVATNYAYDQENRLKTVTTPAGAVSTYTYNGDGLRATKTPAGGSLQTMVWDLTAGLPLLLNDGTAHYIYGPGGTPIEQIKLVTTTVTPTYLHQDQLGSTVLITTSTGTKADTYTYDPYGTVTAHTGTTNTNLQYNGQYADTETGFIYLRARYYDPATVQFLTIDPAAPASRARYAYGAGNPLTNTDPTGLISSAPLGCYGVSGGLWVGGGLQFCPVVVAVDDRDGSVSVGSTFSKWVGV